MAHCAHLLTGAPLPCPTPTLAVAMECLSVANGTRTSTIQPHPGFWGSWTDMQHCPQGHFINAFQLKVRAGGAGLGWAGPG